MPLNEPDVEQVRGSVFVPGVGWRLQPKARSIVVRFNYSRVHVPILDIEAITWHMCKRHPHPETLGEIRCQ